jgi:hypothetical protein
LGISSRGCRPVGVSARVSVPVGFFRCLMIRKPLAHWYLLTCFIYDERVHKKTDTDINRREDASLRWAASGPRSVIRDGWALSRSAAPPASTSTQKPAPNFGDK